MKNRSSKYEIVAPSNSPLKIENAIYLMGRVDENWYHFLLDTAPRMLFLENVPMSVPVLIRSDIPQTSKDFLKILTSREVIEIDPADLVEVEMLYVLPGKSTVFDSRPPKGLNHAEFSPVVLSLFRNKVLENLQINANQNSKQRISFSRKSVTRNVINWGKIRQELDSFSINYVPLDLKFFRSQVQVFSNSNFVVSPGGAILANIIFMNPGSKVVALKSFRGQRVDLWGKLSDSLDLKYIAVNGIPTYWGFLYLRKLHSNYYISPRKLRRILSREI
jgi:capsular polysaccharide biosynthesis protein